MLVKGIKEEDFTNYKVPSMFISTCYCNFKCCTEADMDVGVCQNAPLSNAPIISISDDVICTHYVMNPITKAVVFGGMEPFEQFQALVMFIDMLRGEFKCDDDIVIYTGFNKDEIADHVRILKEFKNIVIKYGRFIPNAPHRYDDVLGIELASDNQYAERIS